jgi:hypothetical protein
LEKVPGGTFFEPENSLHAKQFWRQVKVKELLKLFERERLVGAKCHRDETIVIEVVGVVVMMFVVVVVPMVVVGLVMLNHRGGTHHGSHGHGGSVGNV